MTTTGFLTCLALALVPTITAEAQQMTPPSPPAQVSMSSPVSSEDFVMQAGHSGNTEVALSQLAMTNSMSQAIKTAAGKIETDHKAANAQLMKIAEAKHYKTPDMNEMGPDGDAAKKHLEVMKGADFDKMWVDHMIEGHQKAIDLFTSETKSTDPELKMFAAKTLPTLKAHLAMVQKLKK